MNKVKLVFCFLLLHNVTVVCGQISDNFEDGDLNVAPLWSGMLNSFINENGQLRSNHTITNEQFYLSTESNLSYNTQWVLDCHFNFNPSSLNYIDFFLISDSLDLRKAKNAYFIRLGGVDDEIALYRILSGNESKIIDGKNGLLNASINSYAVSVILERDSLFLLYKKSGDKEWFIEGIAADTNQFSALYTGIRVRQSSSSFFNKHFFDNLYVGKVIKDTIPPFCDSIQIINEKEMVCFFNEICDSHSMRTVDNYMLSGVGNPASVIIGLDKRTAYIKFSNSMSSNVVLNLELKNIKDLENNILDSQILEFTFWKPDLPGYFDLLISELMIDPEPSMGLPEIEYIEIVNRTNRFLNLESCRISDPTTSYLLPNKILKPDSFLILPKIPTLNNGYDIIQLTNKYGALIHEVAYSDTWYRDEKKMEGGYSLEMIDFDQPCFKANNWVASISPLGGTPGYQNSVKAKLLPDTMAPGIHFIEWYDNGLIELHFNEKLDSNSFIEWRLNKLFFSMIIIEKKSESFVFKMPYIPSFDSIYEFQVKGFKDCSGNIMASYPFNIQWPNTSEQLDIVFNELLFNPKSGGHDFIELMNQSKYTFDLSKLFIADLYDDGLLKNIYRLSPTFKLLQPHQYLLISEDTSEICQTYNCINPNALKIQLPKLPTMPDDEGRLVLLNLFNAFIDSIHYKETWHFALLTDHNGVSLERLLPDFETNKASNWHSSASINGFATPGALNSQHYNPMHTDVFFSLQSNTFSPDMDAYEDLMICHFNLPKTDYISTVKLYDVQGRLVKTLLNNETLGTKGMITWDGSNENGRLLPVGIYVLLIECIHPDGDMIKEKLSCVLAQSF